MSVFKWIGGLVGIRDSTTSNELVITATGAAKTDGSDVTQPISASSLPLPTGAATENTLATIDSVLDSIKDTDGVKKITEALPAGENIVGRVRVVGDAFNTTDNVQIVQPNGAAVVNIEDGPSRDAFGRLRVSTTINLFEYKSSIGIDNETWDRTQTTGGTVTYNSTTREVDMAVTGTSGSLARRQTRRYFNYQPGKSMLNIFTFVYGAAVANVRRRCGWFDTNNGLFFEQNGTTDIAFVVRTNRTGSPVDTRVTQTNWNVDKLDGTGSSGLTLDLSKSQILVIDLQYLGVGRVRFGFDIDGILFWCHEVRNANSIIGAYMTRAKLPHRYEIESTAASAGASMIQICSTSILESGGPETFYTTRAVDTGSSGRSINNSTFTPVVAVRLKSTQIRQTVSFDSFSVLCTTADNILVRIIRIDTEAGFNLGGGAGSLTGGSWVSHSPESFLEYNIGATAFTGGVIHLSKVAAKRIAESGDEIRKIEAIGATIAGVSEIVLIAMLSLSNNADVHVSLNMSEVR